MLGSVTVKQEIYARISTQICICLRLRKAETFRKNTHTSNHIFNLVNYLFFIHFLGACIVIVQN